MDYLYSIGNYFKSEETEPLIPYHTYNSRFEQTTRNLENIDEMLADYDLGNKKCQEFVADINKGEWDAVLSGFEVDEFPKIALWAFREGLISEGQFATTAFLWSILQHHDKAEIQIRPFDTEENLELLKSTFSTVSKSRAATLMSQIRSRKGKQPDKNLTTFIENVHKLPYSEWQFFLIPDIDPVETIKASTDSSQEMDDILSGRRSISQELMKGPGINIFGRVKIDGENFRIIPSFGMMQAFVSAYTKEENAVTINPVIGLSSIEDIRDNGITDSRDMRLPFPDVSLPDMADELRCDLAYDFFYHDFYHAIMASCIAPESRRDYIAFYDAVKSLADSTDDDSLKAYYQEYSERIVDLEIPSSRRETTEYHAHRLQGYRHF